MDREPMGRKSFGGGIPGTIRRRVCKACGRFSDEHGRRRRGGACAAFIFSHSIVFTWNGAAELYKAKDSPKKAVDPGPRHDLF